MNFENYLKRAELISLKNFLRYGGETFTSPPDKKYSVRIEESRRKAKKFFEEKFPDKDEFDRLYGYFDEQVCECEEVFFEIGIIAGAKLGFEIRKKMEELL